MKSNLSKLFIIPAVAFSAVCLTVSCGENEKSAFSNFHPEKEIEKYIDGYYSASLGESSNPKTGKSAVYIDFSDGLVQAYTKNPQNVSIIQAITNKLVSPSIEWFALGGGKISNLEYNSNELFNKVSDPKQYKDIMAPIQETLKKITEGNNDAMLVTDYEEYTTDGKEQFENYPKSYFINWLKKGNSITFFYTDYEEVNGKTKNKSAKHLYFTVFTQGRPNENSMISMVRDALKGRYTTSEFTLSNNPYTVSNDYGGKDNTGLLIKAIQDQKNFNKNMCLDKNLPYEVIGLKTDWEKVDKYLKSNESKFLDKLFLNASDQSSYKLNKVSVKVYDASEDYKYFAQCEEAKNHAPKMTKDKGKNDVWSADSKKDNITTTCYEKDKTELKKEWIYSPTTKQPELWEEVFSCDETIFGDHLKNTPEKVELITILNKNYKLKNIKNPSALIRVDIVIEDATFNSENAKLKDFQWNSTTQKDKVNNSLSEAIRNTLQDPSISPKGKILYSYYIKLANATKAE
ncbi:MAG: hypothetical protein FJY21_07300 [Bacteroidetes bacterium]|nr:hypothetical protein [Bacteroidota bacterium]